MAVPVQVLDPTWINAPGGVGPTYDSEELRRNQGFMLAGGATPGTSRTGVLNPRDLVATLAGGNVMVGAGGAVIGSAKGAYLCGVASATNIGAFTPADGTNPRRDRIVLEILDPDNGGGAGRKAQLSILDGTPNALAATGGGVKAEPALAITLGFLDIPKAGGGAPVITARPPMTAAAGAPILVRTLEERDALPKWAGLQAMRLDIIGMPIETCDGSGWVSSNIPWTDVPLMNGFTNYTAANDWKGLRYSLKGGQLTVTGAVTRTTSWDAQQVCGYIPVGLRPDGRIMGTGVQVDPTSGYLILQAAGFASSGTSIYASYPVW